MKNLMQPIRTVPHGLLMLVAFLVMLSTQVWADGRDILKDAIKEVDANVVFLRHAMAPGFGDPDNFSLLDCSTQRNLNENGRKQARAIGFSINKSGVRFNEIISSDWCRCKETAELLNIGKWQTFLGLNSFFQAYVEKAVTLRELDLKLKKLKNGVTLMITHQVVISAVTGISVTSGEMVAYNSVSEAKKVFRLDK
jgi:phosphohistidine phosphatase SixA